jgi:hypothetical protein
VSVGGYAGKIWEINPQSLFIAVVLDADVPDRVVSGWQTMVTWNDVVINPVGPPIRNTDPRTDSDNSDAWSGLYGNARDQQ